MFFSWVQPHSLGWKLLALEVKLLLVGWGEQLVLQLAKFLNNCSKFGLKVQVVEVFFGLTDL